MSGGVTHPRVERELIADEISWALTPEDVPPVEDDPLVAALIDAQSYRLLAQTALHAVADIFAAYAMTTGRQYHHDVDDLAREREAGA